MHVMATRLLSLLAPAVCWHCHAEAPRDEPLCACCRAGMRRLEPEPTELGGVPAWAPLAYEGAARALVRGLKYRSAAALAGPMAAQIAANAPPGLLERPAALVPVPLHPARLRTRGYNQAERLAAALGDRTRLGVFDCLRRCGSATRQVGRDRERRLAALAGAVEARPGGSAPGSAVLVDDVVTTGATLAACAQALTRAGTRSVAAVAFARTPGR